MENTALTVLEQNSTVLEKIAMAYMPLDASAEQAKRKVIREIANVEHWLRTKPDLAAICKEKPGQESLVYAVKQCIQDGLTLAPSADLAYLIPSRVKTGQNGNTDVYEWVVNYEPTANGLLSMARQSGRILDHKRPECKYDQATGAVLLVTVEFLVPSYGQPRWESVTFGPGHFGKWKAASAKRTGGNANPNYTSFNGGIDPEFAGTKAIIHGLNKRGMNMGEIAQNPYTEQVAKTLNDKENAKTVTVERNATSGKTYVDFEEVKTTHIQTDQATNHLETPDLI